MTRHWLAGAVVFAMMTGVAFAQGTPSGSSTSAPSPSPAVGSNSSGAAISQPAVAGSMPVSPSITNYGTGGMQTPPGSAPASVTGIQ